MHIIICLNSDTYLNNRLLNKLRTYEHINIIRRGPWSTGKAIKCASTEEQDPTFRGRATSRVAHLHGGRETLISFVSMPPPLNHPQWSDRVPRIKFTNYLTRWGSQALSGGRETLISFVSMSPPSSNLFDLPLNKMFKNENIYKRYHFLRFPCYNG